MKLSRQDVLDVVRQNPGIGVPRLVRLLGDVATAKTVDAHLNRAVHAGQVERHGSRGLYTYRLADETTTATAPEPAPSDADAAARIAAFEAFTRGCNALGQLALSAAKLLDAVREAT